MTSASTVADRTEILDTLDYWANEARSATTARDEAIAAAVAAGISQREVARVAGLPHTGIQRILKRTAA